MPWKHRRLLMPLNHPPVRIGLLRHRMIGAVPNLVYLAQTQWPSLLNMTCDHCYHQVKRPPYLVALTPPQSNLALFDIDLTLRTRDEFIPLFKQPSHALLKAIFTN